MIDPVLQHTNAIDVQTLNDSETSSADVSSNCKTPTQDELAAVVRVGAAGSDGSGTVVAPNRVLTAYHVVESAIDNWVYINNDWAKGHLIGLSIENDMALLAVDTGNIKPIKIRRTYVGDSDVGYVSGFPGGLDKVAKPASKFIYVQEFLIAKAEIDHGISGGGLLTCDAGEHVYSGVVIGWPALRRDGDLYFYENQAAIMPIPTAVKPFLRDHSIEL
ncbi:MAG: trypsin-like peptidase domain-containing protein [Gammaproteobacteria bacterium]|nr:trypsin-like peptidase domain-containing protein [Gammaproteobacteria bacterium]